MASHTYTQTWSNAAGAALSKSTQLTDTAEYSADLAVNSGVGAVQEVLSIVAAKTTGLYIVSSTALTLAVNGTNSVQTIAVSANGPAVAGDTVVLTYGGNSTPAQPADTSTGATLTTAFCALASVGAGNAVVTGPAGGPWVVTFAGSLGLAPRTAITTSVATTHALAISVTQTTTGVAPGQTITLAAGIPLQWYVGCGLTYPIAVDVTTLWATNISGSQANLQIRLLNHP